MLVDTPSPYDVILGRPSLSTYAAIISPAQLMMNFPMEDEDKRVVGVGIARGDQQTSRKYYVTAVRRSETRGLENREEKRIKR